MKLTKKKTNFGEKLSFKGKLINGAIHADGSGYLEVYSGKFIPCGNYVCEHGTHKMHVRDIEKLAKLYTTALKELKELDKKLKKL